MMELRTENLVVGYDKTPLIKDVNLKVVSGQVLTLIGPNGAGKIYDFKNHYPAVETHWRNNLSGTGIHE